MARHSNNVKYRFQFNIPLKSLIYLNIVNSYCHVDLLATKNQFKWTVIGTYYWGFYRKKWLKQL